MKRIEVTIVPLVKFAKSDCESLIVKIAVSDLGYKKLTIQINSNQGAKPCNAIYVSIIILKSVIKGRYSNPSKRQKSN